MKKRNTGNNNLTFYSFHTNEKETANLNMEDKKSV